MIQSARKIVPVFLAALHSSIVKGQEVCVDRNLGSNPTGGSPARYTEDIFVSDDGLPLQDVECFLACDDISYYETFGAGTSFCQGNACYEYIDVVGRGNCNVPFGFSGTGFVSIYLQGFYENLHLTCTCGSTSEIAKTPVNQAGANSDSPYCVDIDLGTSTSVFPTHEYEATITGLNDIECTLSCNDISYVPKVLVYSVWETGSSAETISDCGVTKSISGPGKVVVQTGGFFRDFRVQCTCSSVDTEAPEAQTIAPTSTSTSTAGGFDPARDDPNWPGEIPKPGTTHRLIINIQYDDYPEETSWIFEEYIEDSNNATLALSRTNTTDTNTNSTGGYGYWVVVDEFVGTPSEASALRSYSQVGLASGSYYRFTMEDSLNDGICCDYGAKGWVTITSANGGVGGGGVVWSLTGDEILFDPVMVDLYVDGNGTVEVRSMDQNQDDNSETLEAGTQATTTLSPTPQPTTPQPTPQPTLPEPYTCLSATAADLETLGFGVSTTDFNVDNVASSITCTVTDCQDFRVTTFWLRPGSADFVRDCDEPVTLSGSNERVVVSLVAMLGDSPQMNLECICS